MKKIICIITIALMLGACDDGFEELNVDPTRPSQIAAANKLTAAIKFVSSERYDNWRANLIYQSMMMQHLANTDPLWNGGDKYTWNRGFASSLMDRYYTNAIKTIEDLLVQLDEEQAPEEMKAIVRILRVFVFSRLTDLYGDVPYSEAGRAVIDGILLPKYDAQSDIYADFFNELEESAAALGTGISGFGAADVIYNGEQAQWKKLANSLMLRLALRLVKVDPTTAQSRAEMAIAGGVMTSNDDIFYLQHDNLNRNGNSEVFDVDDTPRMSNTFIDFLKSGNDPRLPVLAARRSDGSTATDDILGLPNGLTSATLAAMTGEENTDAYAGPNRPILLNFEAPMFFQTYAEVAFMLAESNVRWGLSEDPETQYNNGVTAAMKQLALYGEAAVISDADIATYLTANPYDATNALEQINMQYWVVTFLNEYEAFSNWRRTGIPVLDPVNFPGNETGGTIPRRLTWTENEASVNPANYQAAIDAQGPDILTTRVWWDVE